MIWWSIIIVTTAIFIVLHSIVLPKYFLSSRYSPRLEDRGIKNINEQGGHSIAYLPGTQYRGYLRQYILSERDGKLRLICDFDKNVQFVDFNVALYDHNGQVFKVLDVQQQVARGEAEEIDLPSQTAYVSVKLNTVDGVEFHEHRTQDVSIKRLSLFLGVCSILELLMIFVLKICLARLFGGLFAESFMQSLSGNMITLAIGLVLVAINNTLTIIIMKLNQVKRAKREEKYARI